MRRPFLILAPLALLTLALLSSSHDASAAGGTNSSGADFCVPAHTFPGSTIQVNLSTTASTLQYIGAGRCVWIACDVQDSFYAQKASVAPLSDGGPPVQAKSGDLTLPADITQWAYGCLGNVYDSLVFSAAASAGHCFVGVSP